MTLRRADVRLSAGRGDRQDDGGSGDVVPLSPVDQLVRVSMALRGRRPSRGDIAAVDFSQLDRVFLKPVDSQRYNREFGGKGVC